MEAFMQSLVVCLHLSGVQALDMPTLQAYLKTYCRPINVPQTNPAELTVAIKCRCGPSQRS